MIYVQNILESKTVILLLLLLIQFISHLSSQSAHGKCSENGRDPQQAHGGMLPPVANAATEQNSHPGAKSSSLLPATFSPTSFLPKRQRRKSRALSTHSSEVHPRSMLLPQAPVKIWMRGGILGTFKLALDIQEQREMTVTTQ